MSAATINPASAPSSDRRAAANRLNAQKSTGPRTAEGKRRVARNAVKHGVTARTPLLPGDDPEELVELTAELLEDLDPQTALEREVADRIVGICWRRRRLWRAEEEIIARQFGDAGEDGVRERVMPAGEEDAEESNPEAEGRIAGQDFLDGQDFLAGQFDRPEGTPLLRLANHERRLNGAMDSAIRLLLKLQDRRERRDATDDAADAVLLQNKPNKTAAAPGSSPVQNEANALQASGHTPMQNKPNSAPNGAPSRGGGGGSLQTRPLAPAQNKAIASAVAATLPLPGTPGRGAGERGSRGNCGGLATLAACASQQSETGFPPARSSLNVER